MKHKLILALTLMMLLAMVVAACAPAAPATESGAGAGTKQPPFVIGVSNVSVANSFRVQMIEEIKYYAAQHPDVIKEVIVTDAGGDANKQISDIEDLVTQKVDALLVAPAS